MGKSTLSRQWQRMGVPVHDSDRIVHDLLKPSGKAFKNVKKYFPSVVKNNQIDRKKLSDIVFNNAEKRALLESILHPLVSQSSDQFVKQCRKRGVRLCVLDIPLLYETGRSMDMDLTICVSAPQWVQKRRVMKRKNMTHEKYDSIVNAQVPDYRKRSLSDHVVLSMRGKRYSLGQIKKIKELYDR